MFVESAVDNDEFNLVLVLICGRVGICAATSKNCFSSSVFLTLKIVFAAGRRKGRKRRKRRRRSKRRRRIWLKIKKSRLQSPIKTDNWQMDKAC